MVPSNTRNWSLFQAKLAYQANGGSRIFLGGRANSQSGWAYLFFDENCMKMKEFRPPWGRNPGAPRRIRQCKPRGLPSRELDCKLRGLVFYPNQSFWLVFNTFFTNSNKIKKITKKIKWGPTFIRSNTSQLLKMAACLVLPSPNIKSSASVFCFLSYIVQQEASLQEVLSLLSAVVELIPNPLSLVYWDTLAFMSSSAVCLITAH